ncbi:uncharacterized protein PFL1_06750 [Pseudozyma flocculosa PF-1]|uniref:Related to CCAAT-binding transcription factor subunit aab-1 n=2 Tax=Pseudozyma flocculosa TaxID=84751 RepID=A0A5C3F7I3_9BASI|nr:uncharacterized protein PFL1_06750 [Pseudozyma flocculosa PF-1]EPQ25678.1 hypothetical protein PFL1_06750 [Pseudozyma flocculosa PF-1]SPO40454.1 related to CCAAT-binding transcription factor subunit aab-1 [Pseudozyma flocculosa]
MSKKRSRASSLASNHGSPSSSAHASSSRSTTITPGGPLVHASQDLDDFQESFWRYQMDLVEQGGDGEGGLVDFKSGTPTGGQLPLARIKKVMKSDDEVKMISAEAPILFARACEIFISDLTCRAFLIAEEHKRRTIQRSDIAGAIGRSDLFDFLIDIVPRHESVPSSRLPGGGAAKMERTGQGQNSARAKAAARNRPADQQPEHAGYGNDGDNDDDDDDDGIAARDDAEAADESGAGAYLELETPAAAQGSLNIPHASASEADMASWLNDATADHHAPWPHSFAELSSQTSHGQHGDQRGHGQNQGHVHGLDSFF